jgi:CRISPR-associated protein Cas5d
VYTQGSVDKLERRLKSRKFKVRIRGEWACFTRPDVAEERVSYDVLTPSAARGALEAILWKPVLHWTIKRIHVLAPIRFETFKRSDIPDDLRVSGPVGRFFEHEKRDRRDMRLLRDVDYIVEARFSLTAEAGPDDRIETFEAMFEQRLDRGLCFRNPFLGCREFDASLTTAPDTWSIPEELRGHRALGLVLLDIKYQDRFGLRPVTPIFFEAVMDDGVIEVPDVPA